MDLVLRPQLQSVDVNPETPHIPVLALAASVPGPALLELCDLSPQRKTPISLAARTTMLCRSTRGVRSS
jgi:hypothetical protein